MDSNLGMMVGSLAAGGFALVLGAIGVVLIVLYLRNKSKAAASQTWPSVGGRVISTDIAILSDDDEDSLRISYIPKINYEYEVGGLNYQAQRFSFGSEPSFPSRGKAETFLAPYQSGSQVSVFYNPNNPEETVLVQKMRSMTAGLIVGIILLVAMVCLLCPVAMGIINTIRGL